MSIVNPEFGERLRALRLRHGCGLTQRELALAARLKVANVSAMERGARPCGPEVASRLAAALGLREKALAEFMQLAATTTERGHLWVRSPDFEHLLGIISKRLLREGVDERRIVSVSTVPSASRRTPADVLVVLADGSRAYIDMKVRIERGDRR